MRKTRTFIDTEEVLSTNRISPTSGVSPRNSDNELLIQFLQFHTEMDLTLNQIMVMRSISFESITRARRKLQEKGQYLPTDPKVMKRRRLKAMEIQQVAPSESAAGLQRRIEENSPRSFGGL